MFDFFDRDFLWMLSLMVLVRLTIESLIDIVLWFHHHYFWVWFYH